MISPRTVSLVYFALLFGTPHANSANYSRTAPAVTQGNVTENIMSMTNETNDATPTYNNKEEASQQNPPAKTTTTTAPFCTPATPKPEEGHCIFFLPTGKDNLPLIVVALTVGCLVLLLTTLICACQVCHLRGLIPSLQPRYDNIDRHARRDKRESPCRDEGQMDRHPTETCLMLSEVTTAQEESREEQENKTEEKNDMEQPSTEPPVKDPNEDVTQENSPEPDAKAPESSETGV